MELTKTFSTKDLNLPVILFVGRPTDLNKGIKVFFQAIRRLYEVNSNFITWIIGGDHNETQILKAWIEKDQILKEINGLGKLFLYGIVLNDALPEFYGRADVCVVPSYNETFGMVAVEAMMCGCPVIASNTGGLKDVVKNGYSGFLIEVGNDLLFSIYLRLLIENKQLREWMGLNAAVWSKMNFSKEATYSRYPLIYSDNNAHEHYMEQTITFHFKNIKSLIRDDFEAFDELKDISTSQHTICSNKKFVIKIFKEKMCSQSSLLPYLKPAEVTHSSEELYNRSIFFETFNRAPKILNKSKNPNVIVYERLEFANKKISSDNITELILSLKKFGLKHNNLKDKHYIKRLKELYENDTQKGYSKYLQLGNELNSCVTGEINSNHRIHPQLEIKYLYKFYIKQKNIFQKEYLKNLTQISQMILSLNFIEDKIYLSHGALYDEHILMKEGDLYLIDFETARYTIGESDYAQWIVNNYIWNNNNSNYEEVICLSQKLVKGRNAFKLLLIWQIAEIMYRIIRIHTYERKYYANQNKYISYIEKIALYLKSN
ncbi:MAG: glycosyltransferase family 4 protein [Bacteroidales bacterium]|nr:glycosyltransferase family 4 protein [Bacteroidales bacterium]